MSSPRQTPFCPNCNSQVAERGLCPSCGGKRMSESAAHLVDNVFPRVGVRQWVVTFPFQLRYLLAYNKKALSKALEVTIRAINRFYLDEAKRRGEEGKTGAVTVVQRFGGGLNLNVHFHILYLDGYWRKEGFRGARTPRDEDIQEVAKRIKKRVLKVMESRGWIEGSAINSDEDEAGREYPGLMECVASSIQRKSNEGNEIEKIGSLGFGVWTPNEGRLCSYVDGFSVHARVKIGKNNREGLEHLCRYVARPGISNERLSWDGQGGVLYKLKRAYSDGTTHLRFSMKSCRNKLIALVPAPRVNLTRYHGVLAPRSSLRKRVVQKTKEGSKREKKYNLGWAKLMRRVWGVEVDKCGCGGKLQSIAVIVKQDVIVKI